jgi:hypothetical protein
MRPVGKELIAIKLQNREIDISPHSLAIIGLFSFPRFGGKRSKSEEIKDAGTISYINFTKLPFLSFRGTI